MSMRYEKLPYERVRNLRIDKDLTQNDISRLLNLKQNTYSQYELGVIKYPIEVLIKLALFHDTSVDYLLGLTNNPMPYERK
jgi:transcriptional regulator with XRE-family HTH domain